jgi:hypothetical protein
MQVLLGDRPPLLMERVELGGQVWTHVKAYRIGQTLSVETVTLSIYIYEQEHIDRKTSPAMNAFDDDCRC